MGFKNRYDVAVIGGGITGLTAAVYLAQAGKSIIVFDKESQIGGLSQTTNVNGALFNMGPRAMYEGGAALHILRELNCLPKGGYASKGSMIGILKGEIVQVPTDLSPEENSEWNQLMGSLNQIDTDTIQSVSILEWAERNIHHHRVRLFFYAMCRQWSYSDDMSLLSSGFVIKQGQLAGQGVRYVEGGWQTVVNNLRNMAVEAGATISTDSKVEEIQVVDGNVHSLSLSDGSAIEVSSVVAAVGPDEVCHLIQDAEKMSLGKWKVEARPLYAACMDIALKNLPYPERVFAIGLDEPLYFSNHSASIKLSDNGAHVLHAMKYNDNHREGDGKADEEQLIHLLDLLQPGWDKEVVASRFLPNILVAHHSRTIRHNGVGAAPNPVVPEVRGLFVAGDWVGPEGRLADAAMASAKLAAMEALQLF